MRLSNIGYYIKEGFNGIFRHKAMSLAAITSIVIALFMLGSIIVFGLNVSNIIGDMESSLEVIIFLKDDMLDQAIEQLDSELRNMEGIVDVRYISKADAFEKWKEQFGEQSGYLEGYTAEDNPLPRSYEVRLKEPSYADSVVNALNGREGIEKVQYNSEVADTLNRLVTAVRWMGLIIVGILLVIAVVIIMNTVRLAVFARRNEINIMKYIGATNWFIRWPFIIEGAVIGLIGSVLSLALLKMLYDFAMDKLSGILNMVKFIPVNDAMNIAMLIIMVTGIVAGIIGSAVSIRRYLKV